MDFYFEVCVKHIKPKSKQNHFESKSHKEFDKCEHIISFLKYIDINRVDETFYLYIIENNKKYEYYLIKCKL